MVLPLLLSLTTGLLFEVAAINGKEADFIWLLALHRGNFGSLNLENVYVFLNALGLLFLAVTGIVMWWQTSKRGKKSTD